MNSALMFSKASDEWATPQAFFEELHAEFSFQVDAAAAPGNQKCVKFYASNDGICGDAASESNCEGDALGDVPWLSGLRHWCNPPYSKCREFVARAALERTRGILTVMLVPSRTDTRWFHDHIWQSSGFYHGPRPGIEVRFVRGRLKFGDGKNSAPFPSMVVVFRP